ncbi:MULTISPECIES: aldehyde dehydrogenase family protein [Mumia]|uniref:aldehyde dehydrogenase family protein n=1 Tax=Mumia TaxID=1546255 RepID=UPI0014235D07|nr:MULTISPECIES: aldehyde dehydrogenase family protein [unclassified Mumia]QMW65104.1 aldehyde dehydrogenase family protein [Mumia sp. ZJ1417]
MTSTAHGGAIAAVTLPALVEVVAGEVAPATGTLDLVLEDPSTGESLGHAVESAPDSVERALAAADAAHTSETWSSTSPDERAALLDAVAVALEARQSELAALEAFATGVPVRQTSIVGMIVPGAFRLAAEMLRSGTLVDAPVTGANGQAVEVLRLPVGPAICLVPWNAPAPMAAHKVASALAAGCPTILKPSEYAPYATTLLGTTVAEVLAEAGVDGGVFQLLQGGPSVGGTVVTDPRIRAVSFTGGAVGGRAVAAACAEKLAALQLELGGNNPLVVMPDADPEAAAHAAVDLLTTLNGQWCRALGRLIVPEAMADEVVELALERLTALTAGDPLDEASDLGPIVHSVHRARLESALEALGTAGGTVHRATPVPDTGNYLAPALVTGVPVAAAAEEIFGPIATVHTYATEDEALALANGTSYGLEGYVVGTDTDRALALARRVRAGEVKVNGSTIMSLHLMTPRPAWGLSGLGEEGTVETIRCFTNARVVGVEGSFALHGR